MRAIFGIMRKEVIQIRRDPIMLRMIFLMPLIQMLILSYAINTDVTKIAIDVYDYDRSLSSRELIRSLTPNDYFLPTDALATSRQPLWELEVRFKRLQAEMAVIIPPDFSEKLARRDSVVVALISDGVDANAARTGLGYAGQIVRDFSERELRLTPPLSIRNKVLYNPEAESIYFMVPGIVALLLTTLTLMLTALAIVREREVGTLEQVLVTPISPVVLLIGKILTFAVMGLVAMTLALTVGVFWFQIPFVGSVGLLFLVSVVFLSTTLGIGMLISTMATTQQQALFMVWFFSLFTILTSGTFTPIANMPEWIQPLTFINPLRYFMEIVRGIMLKGSGVGDLWHDIVPLLIYGPTVFVTALLRFTRQVS